MITNLCEILVGQYLIQRKAVTGVFLKDGRDQLLCSWTEGRRNAVFHFLNTLVGLFQV